MQACIDGRQRGPSEIEQNGADKGTEVFQITPPNISGLMIPELRF